MNLKGKRTRKKWDFSGTSTQDKDFWEQMEVDGIRNKEILDAVYENIDNSFFGFDISELANEWE